MKKNRFYLLMLAATVLTISSCSDYPGYKKTDAGLYYKFHVQNESAQKPEIGDLLTINILYKILEKDSLLFNSKANQQPTQIPLAKSLHKGDLNEAFAMMKLGDSASFIVNSDSFYLKTLMAQKVPDFIKAGNKLVFEIKLKSIMKKADYEKQLAEQQAQIKVFIEERKAKEPEEIKAYIKENKITVKPSAKGVYYIELKKGTGAKAESGKTVALNYTGKFLDGTVFDSSEGKQPLSFVLGQKQVIPGFEEGISLMRVGGKAKIIIPSDQAYGENGSQSIKPYSPLCFEIEIISVQ